jgi:transcriptional repressor NrdR
MYIAKKNNRREKYDRNKLVTSLMKACEKRPIPREKVEKIATEIENKFRGESEISSKKLGDVVLRKLKILDKVAYIRFASVYQEFDDVKKFREALKGLN